MKIADGGEAKFGVREGELGLCVPKGGRDQEVCKHGEWGRQSGRRIESKESTRSSTSGRFTSVEHR